MYIMINLWSVYVSMLYKFVLNISITKKVMPKVFVKTKKYKEKKNSKEKNIHFNFIVNKFNSHLKR